MALWRLGVHFVCLSHKTKAAGKQTRIGTHRLRFGNPWKRYYAYRKASAISGSIVQCFSRTQNAENGPKALAKELNWDLLGLRTANDVSHM